jgi:hypothetical protein
VVLGRQRVRGAHGRGGRSLAAGGDAAPMSDVSRPTRRRVASAGGSVVEAPRCARYSRT